MIPLPPGSPPTYTLFPYPTLVRSQLPCDRIHHRRKRRVYDVGRDADGEPAIALAVGALDHHARGGFGAAIEDAHLEIHQPQVVDITLIAAEVLAQRMIERIDRAVDRKSTRLNSSH